MTPVCTHDGNAISQKGGRTCKRAWLSSWAADLVTVLKIPEGNRSVRQLCRMGCPLVGGIESAPSDISRNRSSSGCLETTKGSRIPAKRISERGEGHPSEFQTEPSISLSFLLLFALLLLVVNRCRAPIALHQTAFSYPKLPRGPRTTGPGSTCASLLRSPSFFSSLHPGPLSSHTRF
jgi:hypothetical protein